MEEREPVFSACKMCLFPEYYPPNVTALKRALSLITEAMDLLDAHRGPPSAAGHLAVAQQTVCQDLMNLHSWRWLPICPEGQRGERGK